MELEIVNNEAENRFEAYVDGLMCDITYIKTDNRELAITGTHVPKELAGKGIAADRMTAAFFGETKPVESNENKEGRRKNRRVEFKILKM